MPLTYQDVINKGIQDELARVYRDQTNAETLLISIGFPRANIPIFPSQGNTIPFWANVCGSIDSGLLVGGFESLLQAAARTYPGNPIFSRFVPADIISQEETPDREQEIPKREQESPNGDISLIVTGCSDPQQLISTSRAFAEAQSLRPESVNLGFANTEGILLTLTGWNTDQALRLRKGIETSLQSPENQIHTTVTTSQFRDYLISQLFVEGPDQARFEVNDIRASTTVSDVAQGIISTQYGETFKSGQPGQGRATVVDLQQENEQPKRLNPDKTLHESGVRDGDTLHVHPESRAGSIHPQIREEALVRVRSQVLAYAKNNPGFKIEANSRHAPTDYLFQFETPSFAPPPTSDSEPVRIQSHRVYLMLPADFPMKAPQVFWQTPIFHPNIHPENGKVCLGMLEEHYRPAMDFVDLCQMLVNIAGYLNYAVHEGYNASALKWAKTNNGQTEIKQIGGKPLIELLFDGIREPRPLSITRMK